MPNHTNAAVSLRAGRLDRFRYGMMDRVELVIARHLLDDMPATVVFEDNEIANEIEESPRREDAFDTTCISGI